MSVSILYGENINRDFTEEFNFIEKLFSVHSEAVWNGNAHINMPGDSKNTQELSKYFPQGTFKDDPETRYSHSTGKSSVEILQSRLGVEIPMVAGVVYPDDNNSKSLCVIIKSMIISSTIR